MKRSHHGAILIVFLTLAGVPATAGRPAEKVLEGNQRYLDGDLDGALTDYTEAQVDLPDSSVLHYNIGNVLFRQGDYPRAVDEYRLAELSDDAALRSQARFNIGNAHFLAQEYGKAVEDYMEVLRTDPGDADAKRNLELALQALEQQPPQEQDEEQDQESSEDQDQEQQDSPQDQQEQDQPQQDDAPGEEEGEGQQPPGEPEQPQDPSENPSEANPGEDSPQQPQPQEPTLPEQEAARILDALKQQEKENGEFLFGKAAGMPGEEQVPKEIVDRFGRVEFHGTAMIAILSQGFGFQVSRLDPTQQLLLRGRITEAFTRLMNDPNTLGRVFNRIKFLSQSIWSDRKIGNIIAGMVVSAGLSAYLEDGLLDD